MRQLLAVIAPLLLASACNCDPRPCGIPADETTSATLYVTADDEASVYINGTFVAFQALPWDRNALERTILVNRNPTRPNVVAVLAFNRLKTTGVDRGMLLDFRLGDAGVQGPRIFASGAGWKVRLGGDAGLPEYADGGWTALGFDDSAWAAGVVELPYGAAPYLDTFAKFGIDSAGASWMWAYDSAAVPVASKSTDEAAYFRQVFYFTADGGFSSSPTVCP